MPVIEARRALVVARPEGRAVFVAAVRAAGWRAVEADGFAHARYLLSMAACDGIVVSGDLGGPEFVDGLAWLASKVSAPPVLVAPLSESVTVSAMRHGLLWMPSDALSTCPNLLGALLGQAEALGRQRRRAELAEEDCRDVAVRAERLVNMLWETAPLEGRPHWFTQRYMLERLDEEVERCRRRGTPLAVILGELAASPGATIPGDEADRLAAWMAGVVARAKRRSDVAGHYGQHGFIMVLPQTTAAQAEVACFRLGRVLTHPPHPTPAAIRPCFALADVKGKRASLPAVLREAEERLESAKAGASEPVT